MILYPAIDIKEGKCVRLVQGRDDAVKEYSDNPIQMAKHWENEGAEWLHVVDLDAAIAESAINRDLLEELLQAVRIPVQLGGGMRTLTRIENAIALGASRIVLGTAAVEDKKLLQSAMERFGDYLAVGVDVKSGRVVTRGWKSETNVEVTRFAKQLALHGVRTLIVTDVTEDGMMRGPNFALTEQVASVSHTSVILSGGISSLDDLSRARALQERGVDGVIIGKALYEKKFTLKEALAVVTSSEGG